MKGPVFVLILAGLFAGCSSVTTTYVPTGWGDVDTGTDASLRGLAAVNSRVVFVGGSGGTLLRTLDGGATWTDVAPPDTSECDFRDLEAFDADHVLAMVAGQPARVYRTEDGGATWRIVHEDAREAAFFDAMAFDGDNGVMFGDAIDGRFCLLQSRDAGRTFVDTGRETLPEPRPGEAAFAASGTCLVVQRPGEGVFSLATGGKSARHVSFVPGESRDTVALPLQNEAPSQGAFSVTWNGDRGVAVGGDYAQPEERAGTAAWSDDGGASWHAADAGGYRSAALWLDDNRVLAVGSHGASLSIDGGETWRAFGKVGFHSLAKGRDGLVWACGADGRVAKLHGSFLREETTGLF